MKLQDRRATDNKKLRVLYLISHFKLGGAEICTFELSNLLNQSLEIGVAVVLGNDDTNASQCLTQRAKNNGVAIFTGVNCPLKFGGFLAAAFRLRRVVRDFRPDIVHVNTEIPELVYVLSLCLDKSIRNIPVIRTIHNTALWPRWSSIGAWCERYLGGASVIYVSDAVRNSFEEWRSACGMNLIKGGQTIYNPIIVPRVRKLLLNKRVRQGCVRLLFAGRFDFQKGFDLLPDILKHIDIPPNTKLALSIYGEGAGRSILEQLRDSPPPGWQINLASTNPHLVRELPEHDILLFPSRFEGYGRLAAEGVLAGIPVVAFSIPALSEIFPQDYPWLATYHKTDVMEYSKKISLLIRSLDRAQEVVDAARKNLSDRIAPEKIALDYFRLYERVATEINEN
ncbi:MAG TPA: glycosyltransferase [Sedimenticola sp.]|nr:glycosyltransferase [Sedimenticola sp.]